jgi:hypothetical protein
MKVACAIVESVARAPLLFAEKLRMSGEYCVQPAAARLPQA